MAQTKFTWPSAIERVATEVASFVYSGRALSGTAWGAVYETWDDLGRSFRGQRTFNYEAAVGDGLDNSILAGALAVITESFPEPQLRMYQRQGSGPPKAIPHPLADFLARPHPFLSAELLAKWLVLSLHLDGNAYFYKRRNANGRGQPVALEPMIPGQVRPMWESPGSFIDYYEYRPNGMPNRLAVEDVLHVRLNIDPRNIRRGRSPLKAVLREIFTDTEADAFTAALLRNMGVPGAVLTPDPADPMGPPDQTEAELIKAAFREKFGGENRGETMVLKNAMKVQTFAFSPDQMVFDRVRLIPEARVCSVLQVPPILAHHMVGLQFATYNNVAELRKHFTQTRLMSLWRLVAGELTLGLLHEFDRRPPSEIFLRYDTSDVQALQEDEDAKYRRLKEGVQGGFVRIREARLDVGMADDPQADVYLIGAAQQVLSPDGLALLAEESENPAPEPTSPPIGGGIDAGQTDEQNAEGSGDENPDSPEAKRRAIRRGYKANPKVDAVFARTLNRHRGQRARQFEKQVGAHFRGMAGRVEQRLRNAAKARPGAARKDAKPWTVDDPPPPAENWTEEERRACVDAANAVLEDGGTEEEAIFACIAAAGKSDDAGKAAGQLYDEFRRATGQKADDTETLDLMGIDVEALIPFSEHKRLVELFHGNAITVGELTFALVEDRLGVGSVGTGFDVADPLTAAYVERSGENVAGILHTTKLALRAALREAVDAGEGIAEAAKRIRAVVEETYRNRAKAIARTEVGTAQNRAATLAYRQTGFVETVTVYDGTDDDEACRAANGQVWTLSQAEENPLQHPNCVRAFAPIVGAA